MSLRTGIERIATVIRGAGWLLAIGSLAIGMSTGISEGWQYPPTPTPAWAKSPIVSEGAGAKNPFDQFDQAPAAALGCQTKGIEKCSDEELRAIAKSTKPAPGPWTEYQKDQRVPSTGMFDDLIPKAQKEFSFGNVRPTYMLAGLVCGALLLGLAYVAAWVLVGFAPGN